jgi:hypothetical protein
VKNRIHALLHQHLITPPTADLFGPAGRAWLKQLALAPARRAELDRHLEAASRCKGAPRLDRQRCSGRRLLGMPLPQCVRLIAFRSGVPAFIRPNNSGSGCGIAPPRPGASAIRSTPSRSAMVRATFRMRSCARALKPSRRTAISGVRSPASSRAHSFRRRRGGMSAL